MLVNKTSGIPKTSHQQHLKPLMGQAMQFESITKTITSTSAPYHERVQQQKKKKNKLNNISHFRLKIDVVLLMDTLTDSEFACGFYNFFLVNQLSQ